jgi:hypothetical protein
MMKLISNKAIVVAIGLTALIGAAMPASAQTSYMRVKIPFAFVAGKTSLPAGEYRMQVDAHTRVLQIQPAAANVAYYVLLSTSADSREGAPADSGLLRFQKVDGQYYLGEIWRPAQDWGNKLSMPKGVVSGRANSGAVVSTVDVKVR